MIPKPVYEPLLDFLGVMPKETLYCDQSDIIEHAKARGIERSSSLRESNWVWYTGATPKIKFYDNRTVITYEKTSIWRYLYLRVTYPAKEIIRIVPPTENRPLYMTSTNFLQTFKRTYTEANLSYIGKLFVAAKVSLKPACFYPLFVFVR